MQEALIRLFYNIYLHNADAIAYFIGICLSLFLLIRQPKRKYIFLLIAFTSLLIRFEYLKHISQALQEQTLQTINLETTHHKATQLIDFLLSQLIPFCLYLVGWTSLFLTFFLDKKTKKKNKN